MIVKRTKLPLGLFVTPVAVLGQDVLEVIAGPQSVCGCVEGIFRRLIKFETT